MEFAGDTEWIAPLRMPPTVTSSHDIDASKDTAKCEVSVISLVRQRTLIPIPQVRAFEAKVDLVVNAPFMLMDCIKENVGIDLGMQEPPDHKKSVFGRLANIHVGSESAIS